MIPRSPRAVLVLSALSAAGLLFVALHLPLWAMTLEAPQYPKGLHLRAYGDRIEGDLREINIINHYVGMGKIDEVPAPEMSLFPYSIYFLIALSLLAPLHRRARQLAIVSIFATAVVILVDLQWWLRSFGQNLSPSAPIRVEPFTPLALGRSTIGNFETTAMVSWGYAALLVASFVLLLGPRLAKASARRTSKKLAVSVAASLALGWAGPRVTAQSLQERIDRAPRPGVVVVYGGVHGPLVVRGPLTLEGRQGATIDGGGRGSVIVVEGDGVTIRGLSIRGSGRSVSEEAAGIKATGNGHVFEKNTIEDVYFGIHLAGGAENVVRANRIAPGQHRGARPGHAVSLWYQKLALIAGNRIRDARDGIYLSFADDVHVEENLVEDSRYGVHSMYSKSSTFVRNRLRRNLLGAALMYSENLSMRCNRIEGHREGATAYGVLLKDIDELRLERNWIVANRVGIYADNTPLGPGRRALVRGNLLANNDVALALQSTVKLAFTDNRLENNLTPVRSDGGPLSAANQWSVGRRGNSWDDYRGYDVDGDGIGDLPYRYEALMNEVLRRAPQARALVYTPAHVALETAARIFPIVRPAPLIVDEFPLMRPPEVRCAESEP